jgi:hypothetical protein
MDKKEKIITILRRKILEDKIYFVVIKPFILLSERENIYRNAIMLKSTFDYTDDDLNTLDINILYPDDKTSVGWFQGISVISYDYLTDLIIDNHIKVMNSRSKGSTKEIDKILSN